MTLLRLLGHITEAVWVIEMWKLRFKTEPAENSLIRVRASCTIVHYALTCSR